MQAIRIHQYGGPEVLELEHLATPEPGPGQVRVRVEAAGVNFIDIYQRSGLYKGALPFTPGNEGAGVVEAVGAGVQGLAAGDRVAWAGALGSYASEAIVPAGVLVPLPDGVSTRDGAAAMLQGLTAHYLATSTYPIQAGDSCLVHAAAGGVGLLLCQIAKLRGARVIGTAGSPEKAELARAAGADEVILYRDEDFEAAVKRLTDGQGVNVVYDGVGADTFDRSLNSLKPRGMLALFGAASGPVPPFDPQILNAKGSLFLTRPSLGHYTASRQELLQRSGDLLGWIGSGQVKLRVEHVYPLGQAAEAQAALAGRATTGKVVLETV
jgi:NADPH:quinone reductase